MTRSFVIQPPDTFDSASDGFERRIFGAGKAGASITLELRIAQRSSSCYRTVQEKRVVYTRSKPDWTTALSCSEGKDKKHTERAHWGPGSWS